MSLGIAPRGKNRSDIQNAKLLAPDFYRSRELFELIKEKVFLKSWQFAFDTDSLQSAGSIVPFSLLDGFLNEQLIFTRDDTGTIRCLSNSCTHRGYQLVDNPCESRNIRCGYHGRCFALDGSFLSAPGFDDAKNFPCKEDNLPEAKIVRWQKFLFTSLEPGFELNEWLQDMERRLPWTDYSNFKLNSSLSVDYEVEANWALYVENYLEGLHVPFVHPRLAAVLNMKDYRFERQQFSNLQIGLSKDKSGAFSSLPAGSPEEGEQIGAYYYWLYPNMMFNFYPWGLSLNIIMPLDVNRTRIRYLTYICDETLMETYSPKMVVQTESEDQNVVTRQQKGLQSRLYRSGRYSPQWEGNVQHFHELLTTAVAESDETIN